MEVWCTYSCNFVIKKILPSSTLELYKAPGPKVSYNLFSVPTSQSCWKNCPSPDCKIQTANGNIMPIWKQFLLRFFLAEKNFDETFLVLPSMDITLNGMSFFRKCSVTLDLKNNLVHFPDLSLQLKPHHGKLRCGSIEMKSLQFFVPTNAAIEIEISFGITDSTPAFSQK